MPSEAEASFIEVAASLELYGVELYVASWVKAEEDEVGYGGSLRPDSANCLTLAAYLVCFYD